MTLVLVSQWEDADLWSRELSTACPGIDFRVWPEIGDPTNVTMIAIDYDDIRADIFSTFPNLRCIVFLGHGAGDLLNHPALPPGVAVVRLKDPGLIRAMVEYVVLYLLRDLRLEPTYVEQQRRRIWQQHMPRFVTNVQVGVMGLGSVGEAIAKTLRDLHFQVSGWARSQHTIGGISCLHGTGKLSEFLAKLDYVVCVLPLTTETEGLINAESIRLMKRGVYFINIGRGPVVVEADLLSALEEGHLSGATLDVFQTEPLPSDHPFWPHPKVMITPHESAARLDGSLPAIAENYQRLRRGQPLINLADPKKGY